MTITRFMGPDMHFSFVSVIRKHLHPEANAGWQTYCPGPERMISLFNGSSQRQAHGGLQTLACPQSVSLLVFPYHKLRPGIHLLHTRTCEETHARRRGDAALSAARRGVLLLNAA